MCVVKNKSTKNGRQSWGHVESVAEQVRKRREDGMDWIQKLQAMRVLDKFNTCLMIRDDGSWYLHQTGVERKEGGCLSSGCDSESTLMWEDVQEER